MKCPWLSGARQNQTHDPDEFDLIYAAACERIKDSLTTGEVIRDMDGNLVFQVGDSCGQEPSSAL